MPSASSRVVFILMFLKNERRAMADQTVPYFAAVDGGVKLIGKFLFMKIIFLDPSWEVTKR